MKQLTIYCSDELTEQVGRVLRRQHIDSFVHIPSIYGNRTSSQASINKDIVWHAEAFVVFTEGQQLEAIMNELADFANACEANPCLRMVVTPVEKLF